MKALSKSRFKQGLECPNKLYFSNNKEVYHNVKNNDPFLQALASGGFQVEEYARLQYPGGVLIEDPQDRKIYDYQDLADQTSELLKQENVVIYEAAFYIDDLFIRTDVLVKKGTHIQLIEVKAKSLDPSENYNFVGKSKKIVSSWKPYLFDLAFQTYVTQRCLPTYTITPYLCLVDKTKSATVDGLNQFFRVKKDPNNRTGIKVKIDDISQLGENILHQENLSEVVSKIHNGDYTYYDNLNFHEAVKLLSEIRMQNYYPNWPAQFSACKKCEFKKDDSEKGNIKQSGFEHCFKTQYQWTDQDFKNPTIFNIWDLKDPKLMEQGKLFKSHLTPEDIKYKEAVGKLSRTKRQWLQIEKERDNDFTEFVDIEGLKAEMDTWVYPLHFIDFETSTVPLPFHTGRKPYEQIAFQYSHHIYYQDGRIEHANQYINSIAGEFPNFEFVESLQQALSEDEGTIFKFATHENTILNAIRTQLKASDDPNKESLISFIESISHPTKGNPDPWIMPLRKQNQGTRDMVDLCKVVVNYYYNPHTFGSNSIKKVLPAVLNSSKFIQNKYSRSIGNIAVSSKNLPDDHVWLTKQENKIISPYKTLPPVFENISQDEIETRLSDIENIDDGGAALTAYGKIQYTDMSEKERQDISDALKRYCELDTLAMVMIYEHLKSIV
ncbi:DUF2779 domain-containing protein [Polaribacter sp.]|jgi:hypothetical protein|nr:DUF2779 domain-containing protein [Polaribacter sp.]MDC1461438.1 DUF2779 domain-containing protein [Polaribacter sp.]